MHDNTKLTVDRVRRVLSERVWPAIYTDARPLDVEIATVEGEPIPVDAGLALPYEPTQVGLPWGAAWGTTWFRLSGEVPAEWAGRHVEIVVDLGFDPRKTGFQAEGLVHRPDGTVIKAINPRNQHVPVADSADGGEKIELYIEAASNPNFDGPPMFKPTMEGDVLTSSKAPLYTTRRIDLAALDQEVYDLAIDLEVLFELQAELPEGPRREQILAALDDALDELDLQAIAATATAARACLVKVLSSPAVGSAHQVSAVGHAHIDSAWLWPLRETERKVARTTSSMVDLIDRTDDFLYGMSSAQQYQWIKDKRPELFERIRAAVAAGRFLPLGGMWVESDTVMPSGESLVRQFVQGQKFFEREFGQRSRGVWLPDSFGYSPNLPQLINRAGLEWFLTQKISWNQTNEFPHHTFWWEGIDGSRVLAHFPPVDTYNSELSGEEMARAQNTFHDSRIAGSSIAPTGWGNGGGGTTREMVNKAKRLANLEGSPRVVWEHPDDFYDRAREELTGAKNVGVWAGELYLEIHRATLTSQHQTKQGNRRNEHLLVEAESWAAAAAVRAGLEYPYAELDELWQKVLLLQFHDILPGTSIAWVHREAVATHAEVTARVEAIIERSLAALVGTGDTPFLANGAMTTRDGVPALAVAEAHEPTGAARLAEVADGWVLENDLVTVAVNARGHVTSAVDKASGREVIAPGREALVLQLHQDFPNEWDAWDIDKFYRNSMTELGDVESISASMESGVATVVVERAFGASTVRQVLTLAPGSRVLEVDQATDWHEVEKVLKVSAPLDVHTDTTLAETQYGFVTRTVHNNTSWDDAKFETSMHRYVLAPQVGGGAALINDSVYAYDVQREVATPERADVSPQVTTTLRLTLLRAPRYPDPFTDQGRQTVRYGLVVGADVPSTTEAAMVLGSPRRVVTGANPVLPLVSVTGDGVVLAAVKLAEDKSGDLVVRFYEAYGVHTSGTVGLDVPVQSAATANLLEDRLDDVVVEHGRVSFELAPFEVRTVRFTPGGAR